MIQMTEKARTRLREMLGQTKEARLRLHVGRG